MQKGDLAIKDKLGIATIVDRSKRHNHSWRRNYISA